MDLHLYPLIIVVSNIKLPFLFVACGPDVSVQPISSCKTMSRLSKYSNVDMGIAAAPATHNPCSRKSYNLCLVFRHIVCFVPFN